jgi:hypothetical protein
MALVLLAGWLLGVATGLVGSVLAGTEYYRPQRLARGAQTTAFVTPRGEVMDNYASFASVMAHQGWEPFWVGDDLWFRRPRIHLP